MLSVYLVDKVIYKVMKRDKWGTATVESRANVPARIEYTNRNVINFKGEQAVSSALIWMDDRPIGFDDVIEFDGRDHKVLAIMKEKDFRATKLIKAAVA